MTSYGPDPIIGQTVLMHDRRANKTRKEPWPAVVTKITTGDWSLPRVNVRAFGDYTDGPAPGSGSNLPYFTSMSQMSLLCVPTPFACTPINQDPSEGSQDPP